MGKNLTYLFEQGHEKHYFDIFAGCHFAIAKEENLCYAVIKIKQLNL